ncbi:blastula protease 10-like [Ptychodera flava]|uniref:blastula protease 10-like n=1 Tax=Ptychodera flava TaxID=63121 RepID=UPI00396A7EF8
MKKQLAGKHFDDVIPAVRNFFDDQDETFYKGGIKALQHRWNRAKMKLFALLVLIVVILEATGQPRSKKEKERLVKRFCSQNFPKIIPTDAETAGEGVEGDIMMSPEEFEEYERWKIGHKRRLSERKAAVYELMWPGGIIPYECYAYMGYKNKTRQVSLQKVACQSDGVALHEIGHAIGLMHEHVRYHRDGYVTINEQNIVPGMEGNFALRDPMADDSKLILYDVCSVMHYNERAFSKNGQPTIIANHPDYQDIMGRQSKLSHYDHEMVNYIYNFNEHCESGLVCSNGGYVGKKCTCVCPSGFTGATCDDLVNQSVCGGKITATSTGTVTSPNYPGNYGDDQECHWLLEVNVIYLIIH